MPRTRINIDQINLSPEVPLSRRGCTIHSSLEYEEFDCWKDTLLSPPDNSHTTLRKIHSLMIEHGENIFCILRKLCESVAFPKQEFINISVNKNLKNTFKALINIGIVERKADKYRLNNLKGSIGNTFECFVLMALEKIGLQSMREVQVKYPFRDKEKYDPDGAKYDLLSGLDLTKLLWIECKNPNYIEGSENPLKNVINQDNISKFYRRAWLLYPDIAIYLINTKKSYICELEEVFGNNFLNKNFNQDHLKDYNQIVMMLNNFIYFCRITYKSNKDLFRSTQSAIQQVLHERRAYNPVVKPVGKPAFEECIIRTAPI